METRLMAARLGKAVFAGLVATVVLSMIMILRLAAGVAPWYNPIEIMNLTAQNAFGTPDSIMVGWAIHFVVGALIWGFFFGALEPYMPGRTPARRGLEFALGAWLVVMVTVFPLAGSGFFGLGFGLVAPLFMLMGHIIFGLVMGATFGWLQRT